MLLYSIPIGAAKFLWKRIWKSIKSPDCFLGKSLSANNLRKRNTYFGELVLQCNGDGEAVSLVSSLSFLRVVGYGFCLFWGLLGDVWRVCRLGSLLARLVWVTLEQRDLEGEGHPSLLERSAFGGKNC